MSGEIFQKRTYELNQYIPVQYGEPGYVDPSTIWIPVDKLGWPEAKKMSLVEFISNLHKEQGPYDLVSVNVNVLYEKEFVNPNYYLEIKALRQFSVDGETFIENIPIKNFARNTLGFTLTLENYLPGDTLNYLAFE